MLSADFALTADGLVIDGFDNGSNEIAVSQVGDDYVFTLNSGDWNGVEANGASVDGSNLSVSVSALENATGGLNILASRGRELAVTFGSVDFSSLTGSVAIVGATSIGQTGEGSVAAPVASVLAVTSPTEGTAIQGGNFAGNFLFMANGPIIDNDGTSFSLTGDATFISRPGGLPVSDLNMNGVIDAEDISLWAADVGATGSTADVNADSSVSGADYVLLRDFIGTTGNGGIHLADHPDDEFTITGKATFIAQSEDATTRFHIDVGSAVDFGAGATVELGSVSLFGGDAKITERGDTQLDDSDVETLQLTSEGSITDTGNTDVAVAGLAAFNSFDDAAITLDDFYNFGSLRFDGGEVTIVEQSDTSLDGFSEADSLSLSAAGAITDSPGDNGTTTLLVANNASFTSTTGDDITLDDEYDFGSLTFSGGNVRIDESSAPVAAITSGVLASVQPGGSGTILAGNSLANTLLLNSTGAITDDGANTVNVIGNARFNATNGDEITLDSNPPTDNSVYNFGSLTFDGGVVTVDEASGTVLSGTSSASHLDLTSGGSIVDDGSAMLEVTGNASFDSTTDDAITLDDTYNFVTLTFDGGAVFIREDSDTRLALTSNADSLRLYSAGSIDNSLFSAALNVTNNAHFMALNGGAIILSPAAAPAPVSLGSLTFNGGQVEITEADATVLFGVSTADTALLTSAGSITDDDTADVTVANNASFVAGMNAITLDDTYNFGSLTFVGGPVDITENSSTALTGNSVASTLDLTSNGAITDLAPSDLSVSGLAKFTSVTGDAITLDDTVNLGSLAFMGGAVTIGESSETVLSQTSMADSLALSSTGSITDDGSAVVTVTGNASFDAINGGDIVLTDDPMLDPGDSPNSDEYRFGSLTFDGGMVVIKESDGTVLANSGQLPEGSRANSLRLTSLGSITDAVDARLFVATDTNSTAVFEAGGSIVLADSNLPDANDPNLGNVLAIFSASFVSGQNGDPADDDIFVGVQPNGDPANALVLLNLLNAQAGAPPNLGNVTIAVDGNVTFPPVLPPLFAVVDEALAGLGEDELGLADDLDVLAEEDAA